MGEVTPKRILWFNSEDPDLRDENVVKVAPGMYLVRTQAGFKRVIKQCQADSEYPYEVEGHPTAYPALISIHIAYRGYHYLSVRHAHVNAIQQAVEATGK